MSRVNFIGGSDIAAILGISPWKTAVDLWLEKTQPSDDDAKESAAISRGSRLEPYIIDMIEKEYGQTIVKRNQRYVDSIEPFFSCEVDCETESDNVEIKTVHPFKAKEWGDLDTDQLPLHYIAQIQWGLGITGKSVCQVYALIGDDLRRYTVQRDDETISAMRARAKQFWLDCVVPKVCPAVDFTDPKTLDSLKKLYPGNDGKSIQATEQHEHWRAVFEDAKAAVKRYETVAEGAQAHILAEMGNANCLEFRDGKAFQRRIIKTKACTIEKPDSEYIRFMLINLKPE